MLILKARKFLKTNARSESATTRSQSKGAGPSGQSAEQCDPHVVVVDLYRGAKGRPIGRNIVNAIRNAEDVKGTPGENRVHHLPIDVHDIKFGSHFVREVVKEVPGAKTESQGKKILFVIDEVLPGSFWHQIWTTFQGKFKSSQVWCADGFVPQQLEDKEGKVQHVTMTSIYRLPSSVQRVLYHADWEESRKSSYRPDAQKQDQKEVKIFSVSTNGPTPVCVRHRDHDPQSETKLIDCELCAEELATLMRDKLKLVATVDTAQPGTSSQAPYFLPSSTTIIFSIPESLYTQSPDESLKNHIETTASDAKKYDENIKDSKFLNRLKKELAHVKVTALTSLTDGAQDLEGEDLWNHILVSWTDTFQGLERDVVIFLPGDASTKQVTSESRIDEKRQSDKPTRPTRSATGQPSAPSRSPGSPQPSTSAADKRTPQGASPQAEAASSASAVVTSSRKIPVPGFAKAVSTRSSSPRRQGMASPESTLPPPKGMAPFYWRAEDINRYTEWDKTNLAFAASRCTAQLILLVP